MPQVVAAAAHPEHMAQLADRNDDPGGGDKAGNHRVRQETGEEAHAQDTEQQQHAPGQQGQQDRRLEVSDAAGLGDGCHGGGRHQ